MELARIGIPEDEGKIVKREKYVVNALFPIGFKESNVKGSFLFLFSAYEDYDERVAYFQVLFMTENPVEYDIIKKHPNFIENYCSDLAKTTVYNSMISKMTNDNVYATDFISTHSEEAFYYYSTAVRAVDKDHAEILDLYLPRSTFIRIKCFFENLNVRGKLFPCEVFADPRLENIEYVVLTRVVVDESTEVGDCSKYIDTHYTMYCGPTIYKMNYRSGINKEKQLIRPLVGYVYSSLYASHYYIEYIIKDDDELLVIFDEDAEMMTGRSATGRAAKALRLTKDLIVKTNFLNQFNNVYEEVEDFSNNAKA